MLSQEKEIELVATIAGRLVAAEMSVHAAVKNAEEIVAMVKANREEEYRKVNG